MSDAGEERAHSKLGASSAERWTNCPGSVALCAAIPDPGSTSAARRGSALHHVTEKCLVNGTDPQIYKGVEISPWSYKPTAADIDAVEACVDFARDLIKDADVMWGVEKQFALFDFDAELYGTNDLWAYTPATETLTIVDYKFGFNAVEAKGNKQIRFYALGALATTEHPVSRIDMFILQPSAGLDRIAKHDACEPVDLLEFGGYLAEKAEETRKPGAPLAAGAWCKYCRAAPTCQKLAEQAQAVAGSDFADTALPDDPARMDPATLGERLARLDTLEIWIDAVRAFARAEALAGNMPAGFKFVASRLGHRKWKDAELAMRQAARRFQIGEDALFELKPLSVSKFEKALKKVADKKAVTEFSRPHLAERKQGYSLVPVSDKRDAVTPATADADFSDVDSEDDENGDE